MRINHPKYPWLEERNDSVGFNWQLRLRNRIPQSLIETIKAFVYNAT